MRKWLAVLLALGLTGVAHADIIQTDPSLESGATPISGGTEERLCRKKNGFISCDSLLSDDGTNVELTSGDFIVGNSTLASGVLTIGTNAATTGAVRLENDASISAFNAAGTGNLQLIKADTNNDVVVGRTVTDILLRSDGDLVGVGTALDASNPALKNSGTTLQARLGDDSAFTGIHVAGLRSEPQSETCADSGDGNNGALTLTPTSTYVEITNADANGCDVTMGEGSASAGDFVTIAVISNAGGTVNMSDTAAVSELAGAFNMAVNDTISMVYGNAGDAASATFREIARSNN